MPRKPVDYGNTMIYKLVCNDLRVNDCYVGHTTNFKNRKNVHKHTCINPNVEDHNMPVYKFIRENGGWQNWSMILIDTFECNNKLEAEAKEREIIETLKPTLNKFTPCRSKEEYKQYKQQWHLQHRDEVIARSKEFYETNKDRINEDNKVKTTCNCGSVVRKCDLQRHLKTIKHQQHIKYFLPEETPEN